MKLNLMCWPMECERARGEMKRRALGRKRALRLLVATALLVFALAFWRTLLQRMVVVSTTLRYRQSLDESASRVAPTGSPALALVLPEPELPTGPRGLTALVVNNSGNPVRICTGHYLDVRVTLMPRGAQMPSMEDDDLRRCAPGWRTDEDGAGLEEGQALSMQTCILRQRVKSMREATRGLVTLRPGQAWPHTIHVDGLAERLIARSSDGTHDRPLHWAVSLFYSYPYETCGGEVLKWRKRPFSDWVSSEPFPVRRR